MMDLMRKLFFICARYSFEVSKCYISTKANDIADALRWLSRLQFNHFRQLAPQADQYMPMPVLMS